MQRGHTKDTNNYKPPEHFPDTFATRTHSARSPATTQHKVISNEHKGKTLQNRGKVVLKFSNYCAEFWWLIRTLTCGTVTPLLTSTSPVRSLYLSLMTGRAGFSLRVLERSLKGCSGAGDGGERPISLSPKLWLRLWEPEAQTGEKRDMNNASENHKHIHKLFFLLYINSATHGDDSFSDMHLFVCNHYTSILLRLIPPGQGQHE